MLFKQLKKQSGYSLLELLFAVSIISIIAAMLIPQLILQKKKVIEVSAQRRLKTIGAVMTDYALSHPGRNYADFQELKDAHFISQDVTQTSLITDYSLVFITKEAASIGEPSRFTIIAFPRPESSVGALSTFAITEDNVIRVYREHAGVSFSDPSTWDPVT